MAFRCEDSRHEPTSHDSWECPICSAIDKAVSEVRDEYESRIDDLQREVEYYEERAGD